jgi:hypothetical protein
MENMKASKIAKQVRMGAPQVQQIIDHLKRSAKRTYKKMENAVLPDLPSNNKLTLD